MLFQLVTHELLTNFIEQYSCNAMTLIYGYSINDQKIQQFYTENVDLLAVSVVYDYRLNVRGMRQLFLPSFSVIAKAKPLRFCRPQVCAGKTKATTCWLYFFYFKFKFRLFIFQA